MIPLYIIEEHHEAFYIWNKATEQGFLPPFGNTLLHIDQHQDFECGDYGIDLDVLFSSLEDIKDFTYRCLGIADFICPAIYQGVFNDVVIVRQYLPSLPNAVNKAVCVDECGSLIVKDIAPFSRAELSDPDSNHRLFTYREGGLGAFSLHQTAALDIDLDYFCWDDSLSSIPDKRLEITAQAYREVSENPYHPFRLLPKAWVRPVEENGRYYLSYLGLPKPRPLPEMERIHKRIDLFIGWLTRNKIKPSIISICRSRYSGYTPAAMWADIEQELLKRLSEIYDYELEC